MIRVSLLLALLAWGGPGCGSEEAAPAAATQAEPIADHECASCGMIVREQPSPRGQLVHRDGTRLFFCSIDDLMVYRKAPSPHGAIRAIFVEANDPEADPIPHDLRPRPWIAAAEAFFVVGAPRERIMGPPVLVYAERAAATRVAERVGGEAIGWEALDAWLVAEAERPR
ncbi:MAG: nitrous oxide reductase accessory protein NosL [Myxococcales bacterium]|nr:nitrous oxide reductase accessory protein NosL [Myxococcales bacterium]